MGPGSYDVEGAAHKELMNALYPKKNAPFNITEVRYPLNKDQTPGKFSLPLHINRSWQLLREVGLR